MSPGPRDQHGTDLTQFPIELFFLTPSYTQANGFAGILQTCGFLIAEVSANRLRAVAAYIFTDHLSLFHELAKAANSQYLGFRIFTGDLVDTGDYTDECGDDYLEE